MAQPPREVGAEAAGDDEGSQKLGLGRKVVRMLARANATAIHRGHRAIGTGDVLWALIEDDDPKGSVALRYLEERGLSREHLLNSNRFSDNAAHILKVAQEEGKEMIGTEDLLWAMFASSHEKSRSRAVEKLEERGVSMELVFGRAQLSENAKQAFREAVRYAHRKNHPIVGTEDLLWALFQKTESDSRARHWLTSQHVDIASQVALSLKRSRASAAAAAAANSASAVEDQDDGDVAAFTVVRLFVVGGLAGTMETMIQQPFVYWKTMAQVDANFSIWPALARPSMLFRGVVINAGSIGPISAVQFATHGALEGVVARALPRETAESFWVQMGMAALAGVFSCACVTPAEVVMVTQQRTGLDVAATVAALWRSGGVTAFFNGNVPTAAREAAWTCGFFGATPYLKRVLQEDSKYFNANDIAAAAAASIIAGQAAATISQPADVVASLMKDDTGISHPKHFRGLLDATAQLYHTAGLPGFFRGLTSRSIRCCGAVFILGEAQTLLHGLLDKADILASS